MIEVTGYTPEDLLDTAKELLSRPDAKAKGIWPRAAAHLCRQSLEASLQEFWKERLPGLETMSMRAQLACLPTYLDDAALAGRVAYTWSALSRACHHYTYELAPTGVELEAWMDTVCEMLTVPNEDRGVKAQPKETRSSPPSKPVSAPTCADR